MSARSAAAKLAALALLCACHPPEVEFAPASALVATRVLAVRAEPPDLVPGGAAELSALVYVPQDAPALTFVWVLCDPHPTGLVGTACTQQDTMRDFSKILAGEVPGVRVSMAARPTYQAPADAIDRLPAGSLGRERGVNATALLVVFEVPLSEIGSGAQPVEMVVKSLRIVPDGLSPNTNPVVAEVRLGGEALSGEGAPRVTGGAEVAVSAAASAESEETFVRFLPDGTRAEEKEQMVFSWFATGGHFDSLTGRGTRTIGREPALFTLPTAAEVPTGFMDVYVVLRDGRGGTDWAVRTLRVK